MFEDNIVSFIVFVLRAFTQIIGAIIIIEVVKRLSLKSLFKSILCFGMYGKNRENII